MSKGIEEGGQGEASVQGPWRAVRSEPLGECAGEGTGPGGDGAQIIPVERQVRGEKPREKGGANGCVPVQTCDVMERVGNGQGREPGRGAKKLKAVT
jgi:hypothetical protein